ncbi:MAG: hypothetical protein PHP57_13450 [Sideroxydans sp.]|nr:hypothetical protein [Sideroxydans sp.]
MTTETLMTDTATNTNEGQPASTEATTPEAQATDAVVEQQQASSEGNEEAKAEAKPEGEQEKKGAPEKYEFKQVETSPIDAQIVSEFSEVAKELDLPQDAAQKILDKMAPALQKQQAEMFEAMTTKWATEAKADKEFGGDKLNENMAVVKKAMDTFGTPELRTLLNDTGLGNHPEFIRAFYRAGKAISEDRFVGDSVGAGTSAQRDHASALYPNQK